MHARLKLMIGALGALMLCALAAAPTLASHPRPKGAADDQEFLRQRLWVP